MILEAARGLRAIKKPLAVCGDEAEMNKKLFFLLMLKKVMTKQKKRTRAAILSMCTRAQCLGLDMLRMP